MIIAPLSADDMKEIYEEKWEETKEIHYKHRAAASKIITEILAYYRLSFL
jgi:hypothetical protein